MVVPETIKIPEPSRDDPAEYCLSDAPVARWDTAQARQWLLAISGGLYDDAATALSEYLEAQRLKSSQNSKYAVSKSFLGTTTIEGRNKKLFDNDSKSTNSSSGISTGQLLVTLKKFPTTVSVAPDVEKHFLSAIKRRSDFELRKRSALEEIEKERKRLTQDTTSSVVSMKVNNTTHTSTVSHGSSSGEGGRGNNNGTDAVNINSSVAAAVDVDLNSLFGGEVAIKADVVPMVAAPIRAPAPAAVSSSQVSNAGIHRTTPTAGQMIQNPASSAAAVPSVTALPSVVPTQPPAKKKKLKLSIVED